MTTDQKALLPTHSPVHAGGSRVSREQGFLRENREYFELWREITFGIPASVKTPTGARIKSAINAMEGKDFGERLLFIMAAAEAESPGLWQAICHAGVNHIALMDAAHMKVMEEGQKQAEKLQTQAMRDQFSKQLAARHESYVRENLGDKLEL